MPVYVGRRASISLVARGYVISSLHIRRLLVAAVRSIQLISYNYTSTLCILRMVGGFESMRLEIISLWLSRP